MSQLRRGRVYVQTGNTRVRGIYKVGVTVVSGSALLPGEEIRWGADGAGYVTAYDALEGTLRFYRVAGSAPTVNVGISNLAATKTVTLTSFRSDSVPNFVTELTVPGGGPLRFARLETGVFYSLDAGIEADTFLLTGAYLGTTDFDCPYSVWRDSTTNFNWQKPGAGDIDVASITAVALDQIDATLYGPIKTPATLVGNWQAVPGEAAPAYWKDADRTVHLSGSARNTVDVGPVTVFTLPEGYRPSGGPIRAPVVVQGSLVGVVSISTAGVVRVEAGAYSTSINFDLCYRGEQ